MLLLMHRLQHHVLVLGEDHGCVDGSQIVNVGSHLIVYAVGVAGLAGDSLLSAGIGQPVVVAQREKCGVLLVRLSIER